jgi:hypothetical protein
VEAPGVVPRQEYADGNALGVGHEYVDGLALGIALTMGHMATDTPTAMPSAYIGPDFFYFADLLVSQLQMHINIYKFIDAIHRNPLEVPYTEIYKFIDGIHR